MARAYQTRVALKRIEDSLGEDEVDGQVSSMDENPDVGASRNPGSDVFGLEDSSFKWNAVPKDEKDGKVAVNDKRKSDPGAQAEPEAAPLSSLNDTLTGAEASEDVVFELRDINVSFPGGLSIVTGPTASGKTALLVSSVTRLLFVVA